MICLWYALQVPTATGLTVRVINNVVKKMDVKPRFYDAFRKDGYQGTFQFKQKVHSTHMYPHSPPDSPLVVRN